MIPQSLPHLHLPLKKNDPSVFSKSTTTWSCVYFGEYPQTEIVSDIPNSVGAEALFDSDYVCDEKLLKQLQNSRWEEDRTMIDGVRYGRIQAHQAVTSSKNGRHHFRWKDPTEVHYFRYDPIKWRVLDIQDGKLTLLADKALDCHPFHDQPGAVHWESSALRQWLNGAFLGRAFSAEEQSAILAVETHNPPGPAHGVDCGNDTIDKVRILSLDEIYASETADRYGFSQGYGMADPARRFGSTLYAKCRGAWWSPTDVFRGNTFWITRTNSHSTSSVVYICDWGYVYLMGVRATCDDAGIIPMICIDPERCSLSDGGEVSSYDPPHSPETLVENMNPAAKSFRHVSFGSYPQSEIVPASDDDLFRALSTARWNKDETTVNGVRVRRVLSPLAASSADQNEGRYRYFRCEPILWRVLRQEGDRCFLMSEKALDCHRFSEYRHHVDWKSSEVRAWLNGDFYATAFSESEQKQIEESLIPNRGNLFFYPSEGEPTADHVFLLADDDVFFTPKATQYGFSEYSYSDDPARQIPATAYAQCRGAWCSDVKGKACNCTWFLRTCGYTNSTVVYVGSSGGLYNRGCSVDAPDVGIVPVLCVRGLWPEKPEQGANRAGRG